MCTQDLTTTWPVLNEALGIALNHTSPIYSCSFVWVTTTSQYTLRYKFTVSFLTTTFSLCSPLSFPVSTKWRAAQLQSYCKKRMSFFPAHFCFMCWTEKHGPSCLAIVICMYRKVLYSHRSVRPSFSFSALNRRFNCVVNCMMYVYPNRSVDLIIRMHKNVLNM